MTPDTWNLSRYTRVISQYYLLVYLSYLFLDWIYHHINLKISGQYLCYNHCLFTFQKCVHLFHAGNYLFIDSHFFTFDQGQSKSSTISWTYIRKPLFLNDLKGLAKWFIYFVLQVVGFYCIFYFINFQI